MSIGSKCGDYSDAVVDTLVDVLEYEAWTIEELARQTGLSPRRLQKCFRKLKPFTLTEIDEICLVLHLSPAETLGEVLY